MSRRPFSASTDGGMPTTWVVTYGDMMTTLMMFFLMLWSYTETSRLRKDVPTLQGKKTVESRLDEEIKQELEEVATVNVSSKKVSVTLPSAVLFGSGSADLKPEASPALRQVATFLMTSTAPVVVEGHTDDEPIQRSHWRSNYELSSARAFAVIGRLIQDGVPAGRLSARGYGPHRPVVPNDSDEHKQRNRRIDIHLWVPS